MSEMKEDKQTHGDKKWYIVHALSGAEYKAKANLESRIASAGLQEKIDQIIIPTEQVAEIKHGQKRVTERRFYPGYILIHMEMNEETWLLVKSTPGITSFIGPKNNPTPLYEDKVEEILKVTQETQDKPQPKVEFKPGEAVRIVDGPFMNFTGVVEELNPTRGKLKVNVSIFGRLTPIELEYWQIEKL